MQIPRDKKETLTLFGAHLRQIRLSQGVSQEELAYRTEMTQSHVGRLERGTMNVTLFTVYRIADALQIKPKELLDF